MSRPNPRVVVLSFIFVLAVFAAYLVGKSVYQYDTLFLLGGVIATFLIGASLIDPRVSLGIIVVCMMLSPEIPIGTSGSREVALRAEDFLIPLTLFSLIGRKITEPSQRLIFKPLFMPMILFVAVSIGSTFFAYYDGLVRAGTASLYILKTVEFFLVYFLALNVPRNREDADRILWTMFATAIVVFLITSSQIGTVDRLGAPFEGDKPEPNTLGGYLALMIAILGGFVFRHPSERIRTFCIALILALTLPLLFTLSRSSYLALGGIGLTFIFVERRPGIAIGVITALFFIVLLAPDVVRDRVETTAELVEGPFTTEFVLEGSAASKFHIWVWFKIAMKTRPFLGWGTTGAGLVDSYYPRAFAEGGVFGFGLFLLIQFSLFRLAILGRRSKDAVTRALSTGYLAGLVGLSAHSLGANTFIIVRIMEPFWLVTGLIAFRLNLERSENDPASVKAPPLAATT